MITVIDNKKNISIVCCKSDAARVIGVCRQTIYRWIIKGKAREEYNHYTIIFATEVKKQLKGNIYQR